MDHDEKVNFYRTLKTLDIQREEASTILSELHAEYGTNNLTDGHVLFKCLVVLSNRIKVLQEQVSKRTIFSNPVDMEMFTLENTLKQMESDKDKLVKFWGQGEYDERLAALKEAICTKQAKGS